MRRSVQFVTGNEGKYREVLEVVGHELEVGRVALDLVEVQGSADEVARDKCARAAAQLGGPVLTEDTCLSFDAMQGKLPGPYIKWFLDAVGTEGLCKMLDAFPTRGATAVRESRKSNAFHVMSEFVAFFRFVLLLIVRVLVMSLFCFVAKSKAKSQLLHEAKDEDLDGIPFSARRDRAKRLLK